MAWEEVVLVLAQDEAGGNFQPEYRFWSNCIARSLGNVTKFETQHCVE